MNFIFCIGVSKMIFLVSGCLESAIFYMLGLNSVVYGENVIPFCIGVKILAFLTKFWRL